MFRTLSSLGRLARAGWVMARHDALLPREYQDMLPAPARLLGRMARLIARDGGEASSENLNANSGTNPGARFARALEELGPAYVKLGQFLATRGDILGAEFAEGLSGLKDRLPPFPTDEAVSAIATELGDGTGTFKLDAIFPTFGPPCAAASIAQVHKARTPEGADVAVKVLRPGIERAFRRDIDAFYFAARIVDLFAPGARRLKPMDVIEHFDGVVQGELDLRLESAAASEFAANTSDDKGFQLPEILWNLSARRVMTLDWADGVALGDNEALDAAGHDRKVLAENVMRLFLMHALRDGYFHADMHQGNLKVAANGDIIAYDFGIMGHIDEYTRRVYAEILFGFIRRDYNRVAKVHFEAGYVPADRDVDEFARALRAVGEPIFGKNATGISMGKLLTYLFEVTERFGMETRTELILLQRTMVVVEGVARSLDPQINIWEAAKPVVEDYIKGSIGPKAILSDLTKTARVLARFGPRLPGLVEAALMAQAQGSSPKTRTRRRTILWAALIGAGVGGVLAMGLMALV